MKYVKICKVCGHKNSEVVPICEGNNCQEYLGEQEPVPDIELNEPKDSQSFYDNKTTDAGFQEQKQPFVDEHSKTKRFTPQSILFLEYSGRQYDIESGMVMGKEHPETNATLKVPGLPDYVHRNHCKFDFQNGQWTVTAIQNPKFTNPTYVNTTKVAPNQTRPLANGDQLTLCDITFNVTIL
jgi:hypothetical protein